MTQVIISQLPPPPNGSGSGSSKGTDLFPATDVTDVSTATTGTTKKYTLSEIYNFMLSAQGLTTYQAVRVATTGALTVVYANGTLGVGATLTNAGAQAILSIDGVTLSVGDRVLVKEQASTPQNGIYTVTAVGSAITNWVMTRAIDYDQSIEIVQFGVVLSNQGTINAGKLWQETAPGPFTIGTTPIIFSAYSSQQTGINWTTDTTGVISAVSYNGYVCANAGTTIITLPDIVSVGSVVIIEGLGAGGWVLTANAGQTIQIGVGVTSTAGMLSSAASTDNVYVVCIVNNTTWRVTTTNSTGLTIA